MSNIMVMDEIVTDLSYYDKLAPHTYIYVKNLKVQGWYLLNKVGANGDDHEVYWYKGRASGKWIRYFAIGGTTPELKYIKWYNDVSLYDYSRLDSSRGIGLDEPTMLNNINTFIKEFGFIPTTPSASIEQLLKNMDQAGQLNPAISYECQENYKCPSEWYPVVEKALIGGSSVIQPYYLNQRIVSRETHIDYHQIYGSVLRNEALVFPFNKFNFENMQVIEGYHECKPGKEVAIYVFSKDSYATARPLGYALFGPEVDLSTQSLCNVDLETLIANYEVHASISYTLLWTKVFHGGKDFLGPLVDRIYEARKRYKGTPAEGVFKVYNEILPGYFSRTCYVNDAVWRSNFKPKQLTDSSKCTWYSPCVGIFINAYARAMLNNLLMRLPYDRLVGWDTDAAFFKGTPAEVPTCVKVMYGDEPGQLHIDGDYSDVFHKAPKSYWGIDCIINQHFSKRAGVPTSGNIAVWNYDTHTFDIKRYTSHTKVRK